MDFILNEESYWISLIFSVWSFFVLYNYMPHNTYVIVTGIMYFFAFWRHLSNRKDIPIIISGVITVSASYILTQ